MSRIESLRAATRFIVDDVTEAVGARRFLRSTSSSATSTTCGTRRGSAGSVGEYGICCALHSYIEDEATTSLCEFMDDDADHAVASDKLFQSWRAVRPAYDRDDDGITEWEILQAIRTAAANTFTHK